MVGSFTTQRFELEVNIPCQIAGQYTIAQRKLSSSTCSAHLASCQYRMSNSPLDNVVSQYRFLGHDLPGGCKVAGLWRHIEGSHGL